VKAEITQPRFERAFAGSVGVAAAAVRSVASSLASIDAPSIRGGRTTLASLC
jgi:hypothetical protein